jgi:hypothetical protein
MACFARVEPRIDYESAGGDRQSAVFRACVRRRTEASLLTSEYQRSTAGFWQNGSIHRLESVRNGWYNPGRPAERPPGSVEEFPDRRLAGESQ